MSIGTVSRDGYLQPQPLPQALAHPLPRPQSVLHPQPRCRLTWRHAGAQASQAAVAQLAQATGAQVTQGAGVQVAQGAVAQVVQQVSQVGQHLWQRPAWAELAKHTIANARAANIEKRFIKSSLSQETIGLPPRAAGDTRLFPHCLSLEPPESRFPANFVKKKSRKPRSASAVCTGFLAATKREQFSIPERIDYVLLRSSWQAAAAEGMNAVSRLQM
jgi:hypothetical protein